MTAQSVRAYKNGHKIGMNDGAPAECPYRAGSGFGGIYRRAWMQGFQDARNGVPDTTKEDDPNVTFGVAMKKSEADRLKQKAETLGISVSEYIRIVTKETWK